MTPLSLHCTRCAFITTTTQGGMAHVRENPDHTVIGPGRDEGTTITITVERG
jgi:hypothetical protein